MSVDTWIVIAVPGEDAKAVEVSMVSPPSAHTRKLEAAIVGAVGGDLETFSSPLGKDLRNLPVWVDADARRKGLRWSHWLRSVVSGGMVDIRGPIVVTGAVDSAEDTTGLEHAEALLVVEALNCEDRK